MVMGQRIYAVGQTIILRLLGPEPLMLTSREQLPANPIMSNRQPLDTALTQNSIWNAVSRDEFFRKTTELEQKVAGPAVVYTASQWPDAVAKDSGFGFSFDIEQQLADDFAFLAAREIGTFHVSAAAIELSAGGNNMMVRLAANEGIEEKVRSMFEELLEQLRKCARRMLNSDITPRGKS